MIVPPSGQPNSVEEFWTVGAGIDSDWSVQAAEPLGNLHATCMHQIEIRHSDLATMTAIASSD